MIEFDAHPDCTRCPLYQSATNPGLPTRPLDLEPAQPRQRAVLFVGQSPGHTEDKQGRSFVGWTGQLLEKFIDGTQLRKYANIFLANSCRCKPPQDADESQSQIRKCRDYLVEDVAKLQTVYEEVIIMNLGAKAVYATFHLSSLNEALKKQATFSPVLGDKNIRVFSTYHPAILHAGREPGKVKAVETHFSLLLRYLKGEFIPNELQIVPEVFADVPEVLPERITLDIETYGILEGVEQTVFQPIKSKVVDKTPYQHQIITVSFAWQEEDKIRTALYMFRFQAHRQKIREWFRKMSRDGVTCTGQNIKFDLLYLKSSGDPELAYWIDPRRLLVDDTLLMSFLLYEQQPEKGLKELSTLFGITDYSGVRVTGKSGNAKSCWDKDLHYYNCLDAAATLVLHQELTRRIREQYGDTSPKLSDVCAWLRNVIIWDTLALEENGSAFNVPKLEAYHKQEMTRCEELLGEAEALYEMKLAGPGSDKPLRQLMLDCLAEADMMSDSRVMWTGKEKKISIGVENVNLVKDHLPDGKHKQIITAFQEYKERSKIVTTYTRPLLTNPRKGCVVYPDNRVGIVFPSWYPVPTYAERGGSADDKAGGQIQGRFSCKKPARQTEPSTIRQCSCSRWPGGTLVECDMSQDHLRMAALLSGDPELMEAYQKEGESIHVRTAATIFPELDRNKIKKEHPDEYKLGKTLNFAVIFRCGPGTFQQTALHDVGIELDIGFCAMAIRRWAEKHSVYWDWQDKMIDLAARQGYLILPTGWSRTFGLGQKNIAGQIGEVLNFAHQTPCAQLTHSAQYKIQHEFLRYRLRSLVCLNIYDALFVDCYPGEDANAKEILFRNMNNPPLLPVFERWVGRTIPWAAELKEYKQ